MLSVKYKDKDIYPNISVNTCILEKYSEKRANYLNLILNDAEQHCDEWGFQRGETIEVQDGKCRSGKMYIWNVGPSSGHYTIEAYSMPPDAYTPQNKSWEQVHFLQLGREVAQNHNLEFKNYYAEDHVYDYCFQNNVTDLDFFYTRCQVEGCSFLIYNGNFIVYDERKLESQTPVLSLNLTTGHDFKYSDDTFNCFKKIVLFNNTVKGGFTLGSGSSDGQERTKRVPFPMSSQEEAERFAKNYCRYLNRDKATYTFHLEYLERDISAGSVAHIETDGEQSWNGDVFVEFCRFDMVYDETDVIARKVVTDY